MLSSGITESPVPPAEMMMLATGGKDKDVFLTTGSVDKNFVLRFLQGAGLDISKGKSRILDWGCGCGRIARHWESLKANVDLFGCDVAEGPVRWCQDNLRLGTFSVSTHNPPLSYPDGHFDAIYAVSVLTHLTFESQYLWMRELWRLLRPDGVAVLTAHGPSMLPMILPAITGRNTERVTVNLIDEEIFLCVEAGRGANETGNLETRGAFSRIFHPFQIVEYGPRHGLMGIQDSYVVRKKSAGPLTVIEKFLDADMTGRAFHGEVQVVLDGERSFCVLATAPNLVLPARIQLSLRRPGSADAVATSNLGDLPARTAWAHLGETFSSLIVENIPQVRGPIVISADVTGSDQLNGSRLQLRQAVLF